MGGSRPMDTGLKNLICAKWIFSFLQHIAGNSHFNLFNMISLDRVIFNSGIIRLLEGLSVFVCHVYLLMSCFYIVGYRQICTNPS